MRRRVSGLAAWLAGAWGWGCAASTNASAPGADAAQVADAVVFDSGTPARDVGVVPSEQAIVGRWRAVRYRSTVQGQPVEFGDAPPTDQPGARWMNGVLIVRADGLRMNVGMFGAQGPLLTSSSATGTEVYWRHQIRSAEGRWRRQGDELTFDDARLPPGNALRFSLDAEGLLWLSVRDPSPAEPGFSLAFARDLTPTRLDRLDLTVPVQWREEAAPAESLRPVLFWDAPGAITREQGFTLGTWLGAAPRRTNAFTVSLAATPGVMFQGRVGGVAVAVAYPSAYTDADRDGVFSTADGPAMSPPLAIVWRGEGPDDALRGTQFEGFLPGYSYALPNWIPVGGAADLAGLVPFDNTVPPGFTLRSDIPSDPRYRLADFVP
jgi:hypothetical protein